MEKREYVVTVYDREDLGAIYEELECEHGGGTIPARACKCICRRPLSRNTHYLLTDEEAAKLKKDLRVWDVQLTPEELGVKYTRNEYAVTQTGDFDKSIQANSDSVQWGLYRNFQSGHDESWAVDATPVRTETINYDLAGRNVDIVIVDDTLESGHPEWAENQDGTGDTRFKEIDWFGLYSSIVDSIDDDFQSVPTHKYLYHVSDDDYHGHCVASCAAGSRHGMAKSANIYNLEWLRPKLATFYADTAGNVLTVGSVFEDSQPITIGTRIEGPGISGYRTVSSFGTGTGGAGTYNLDSAVDTDWVNGAFTSRWTDGTWTLLLWDYLRAFHRYKDVNPETGKRNPTIANCSFGASLQPLTSSLSNVVFQGTTYTPSTFSPWTPENLEANFALVVGSYSGSSYISFISTATKADVEDAVAEGILFVCGAGNDRQFLVDSSDPNYNNTTQYFGTNYYYNRGDTLQSIIDNIVVGSCTSKALNYKSDFSGKGSRVDIYAAGENVKCAHPFTKELCFINRWEVTNNVATFRINAPNYDQGDILSNLNGKEIWISIDEGTTLPQDVYTITSYSYEQFQFNATIFTVNVNYPDTPQTATIGAGVGNYTVRGQYPLDTRGFFTYQTSISGTSFSAPNVTGLLACWMEVYRRMDYWTAYSLLLDKCKYGVMYNTTPPDYSSDLALYASNNYTAGYTYDPDYYQIQDERPREGLLYPKTNYKARYDAAFRAEDLSQFRTLAFPRVATYR